MRIVLIGLSNIHSCAYAVTNMQRAKRGTVETTVKPAPQAPVSHFQEMQVGYAGLCKWELWGGAILAV